MRAHHIIIPRIRLSISSLHNLLSVCLLSAVCAHAQPVADTLTPLSSMPAERFAMAERPWVLEGTFSSPAMETNAVQTFAGTRQSSSKFKGWDLGMIGGQIRFMSTPLRGTSSSFLTDKRYDDGREHSLRLVWNPQSRQAILHVDGEPSGSVNNVAPVGAASGLLFVLGAKQNPSTAGWLYKWKGALRDWRFYAGVLPENLPPAVEDVSAQELAVGGQQGGVFDAAPAKSEHMAIAPRAALPAQAYGMEERPWVLEGKFSSAPMEATVVQTIAGTRQSSSKFKGWDLGMIGGQIRFMSTPLRGTSSSFLTGKRYDDGREHLLRLAWEPQGRLVTLCVDGEQVGRCESVTAVTGAPGLVFVLGAKQDPATGGWLHEWKGNLSDWRFYPNGASGNPAPPSAAAPVQQPVVSGRQTYALKAVALKGPQAALTWREGMGTQRKILAHDKPITEENRGSARVVVEKILPGSANDWYEDPSETNRTGVIKQGWVLGPDAPALNPADGLFVHTAKEGDPGEIYFAVLADGEPVVPGENATTAALSLKPGMIEAIPQDEGAVAAMKAAKPGLPIMIYLHPHTSRPQGKLTHLFFGDDTMGWREGLPFKFKVTVNPDHILLEPHDRVWINRKLQRGEVASSFDLRYRNIESWWYGTNEFINDPDKRAHGRIMNYTDRWLNWMLDWVIKNYHADATRVYGFGTSMGTAVQIFAVNNPERFASVDVLVPFVDWSYVGAEGSNLRRLGARLGGLDLKTPEGKTLAEEMNLIAKIDAQTADWPFVVVRCGRNDKSVFWERKPAYFEAMNRKGNGLLACWDQGDHATAGRAVIPGFPNYRDPGWYVGHFATDKSYPAIVNYSGNDDYGDGSAASGAPVGFINRGLDWKVEEDAPTRYKIKFFRTEGAPAGNLSFDFVVRRPQAFRPDPGTAVEAEFSGSKEKRTLRVGADARVRVDGVVMSGDSMEVSLSVR